MKAARLHLVGDPLRVEEVPDPEVRPSGVVVRVLSTHLPAFTGNVLSGKLGYAFPEPLPFTPGTNAVGVVEAVADDVFGLDPGQWVFCDPFIASRRPGAEPDGILIAWTGLAPASHRMQSLWRDGTFAEKVLWPAECLTVLEGARSMAPESLAYLSYLTIAYGGLQRGRFGEGQTLVVMGATGGLGAASVLLALALGAFRVVAVGRDGETLARLVALDPKRVVAVPLVGKFEEYTAAVSAAAGGADMLLDMLGPVKSPEPTLAGIHSLRRGGTAVFMGGVQSEIPVPYAHIMLRQLTLRGAFMYPRSAPGRLMRMISSGILSLEAAVPHPYPLQRVEEAINAAAGLRGLDYCVVNP